MTRALLIQKAYGTEIKDGSNVGRLPEAKALDMGLSRIFTGSTFVAFDPNGTDITASKVKASDDFGFIGYSGQGLPFTILMDGAPWMGERRQDLIHFADHISQQVTLYAERLSSSTEPEDTVKQFIFELYQQLMKDAATPEDALEFTLSMAITYEKDSNLYCAGFGIGDIGLVLKRTSGVIETLASNTIIYDESAPGQYDRGDKDGFTGSCGQSVERQQRVIDRNSVFNVSIEAGDEIFGYTSLPNSMCSLQGDAQFTEHFRKDIQAFSTSKQQVVKSTLDIQKVWPKLSHPEADAQSDPVFINTDLLTIVANAIEQFGQNDIIATAQSKATQDHYEACGGDDCAMTSMRVPEAQLQQQLKTIIALQATTEAYLESHHDFMQRLRHKGGRERAAHLLAMIHDHNNYDTCIRQAAASANQSSNSHNSYARYIQRNELCQAAVDAVQAPNKPAAFSIASTTPVTPPSTKLTDLPERNQSLDRDPKISKF